MHKYIHHKHFRGATGQTMPARGDSSNRRRNKYILPWVVQLTSTRQYATRTTTCLFYSLNSLSVRVPHNFSTRVGQCQTPDRWPGGGPAFSLQFCDCDICFLIDAKISHGKYKGLSVTSSKSITVIENEDVLASIYALMLHYSLSLYNPMCFFVLLEILFCPEPDFRYTTTLFEF